MSTFNRTDVTNGTDVSNEPGVRKFASVRFGAQNLPDWSNAVVDRQEELRRLKESKAMLDEMKRTDPGGDIQL
jgi:hypothetical protein